MAVMQEAIRRLQVVTEERGAQSAADKLNALAKAQGDVAVASEKTERATQSMERRLESIQRRYDQEFRAQRELAKLQRDLDAARSQGLVTQSRASELMQAAIRHHNGASSAAGAHAVALSQLEAQAGALAGRLGPLGAVLSALGPVGLAAGAAIGILTLGATKAVNAFETFESHGFVMDSVLKATGMSAGRTAGQIEDLVTEIGNISKTREAANVLLTFRSVAGETFDRTLKLADDLAAVMKTDVTSAALQLGKALEDPEKGLSALTRSGVSFSQQQKEVIKNLYETGRTAEAQRLVLDQVAKQVGGAGAAADSGLAGAYEALSDATQRLLERWGKQIAEGTRLASVLKSIADVIDRGDKLANDPSARLTEVQSALADAQSRFDTWSKQGNRGQAAEVQKTINALLKQEAALIDEVRIAQQKSAEAASAAAQGQAAAEAERRAEAYQGVAAAISKEIAELKKSELQKAVDVNLRKAQVDASSAEGREIIRLTTARHNEAEAVKRAADAQKEAEALSKRQTEALRRFNEQIDGRLSKLAAERAAMGLSEEAALALKTAEEDLARLRERGVVVDAAWEKYIRERAAGYAREEVALRNLKRELETLRGYAQDFGSAFNNAIASGKNGIEALGAAVDALGKKLSGDLMTKGVNNIVGSLNLGSPQGIDATQLAQGGGQALLAIGISLLQADAAKRKQAIKEWEEAQERWRDMQREFTRFVAELNGVVQGELGSTIQDAVDKAQEYADAAHEAGQATDDLQKALTDFATKQVRDFIGAFDVLMESLDQGLGPDGVAVKAGQAVKSVAEQLQGVLSDVNSFAPGSAAADKARASSQDYLLSLLQTAPVLTDVETRILELRGTAAQLALSLQDLGMSAADAGAAISEGVGSALAELRDTFTQGLQQEINSATGKGYLNDISSLLDQAQTKFSDAQLLGADPLLIGRWFAVQAQQIVDSAGLVGTAFDDLIGQFPELAGVVSESTTAIAEQIEEQRRFRDELRKSIDNYVFSLQTGAQSSLSPAEQLAAAQQRYQEQLALAQTGDRDALSGITQAAQAYLEQARNFMGPSSEFGALSSGIVSALEALPDIPALADPVVTAIEESNATLKSIEMLQELTKGVSSAIALSTTQLGAQTALVADQQGSIYFGPMVNYLSQIAANTLLSGQPAQEPEDDFEWWNPFTWFRDGGLVGRYAGGGRVGNGVYDVDSVRARYAGGGDIALAGGEYVTRAPSVTPATMPILDAINRTGQAPSGSDPELIAEVRALRSDNRMLMAALARLMADGNERTSAVASEVSALRTDTRQVTEEKRVRAKSAA